MRYLDADTIADARNAYGMQVPLDVIAGRLGISVGELRQALGLPALVRIPIPKRNPEAGGNLFDRLCGGDDNARL